MIAAIYDASHEVASTPVSPNKMTSFPAFPSSSEITSFPVFPEDSSNSDSAHIDNAAVAMQPASANPPETLSARRRLPSLPHINTSIGKTSSEPMVVTQSATWSPAQAGRNSGEVAHSAAMQSLTKTLDNHGKAVASMDTSSPEAPSLLRWATHLLGNAMQRHLLSDLSASEFQRVSIDNIEDVHSAQAVMTEFKKILTNRTKQYRMNEAEREQFVDAYKRLHNDDEEELDIGAQVYAQECEQVRAIVAEHPELEGIPIEGLVAIREWTGDKLWKKVQDIFEQDVTEDNWESLLTNLPLAKAIISGLNTLPDSYTYKGTVYTGEDQPAEWIDQRYKGKDSFIDFRFFAASRTEEGKWQNRNVNWETESLTGKWIKVLSKAPHEDEVLLSPGTGRGSIDLTQRPGETPDRPNTLIRQKERV
ncbi:MAG TPA: hypothetical protein VM571_08830 [Noviherbaspirillum sp.]|nr:hypothetical protein [Noviherbaspirillum sp.]